MRLPLCPLLGVCLVAFLPTAAHAQRATAPTPGLLASFARHGDIEAVDTLLARGADIDDVDADGDSALVNALQQRHFAVAIDLIDHGAKTPGPHGTVMPLAILRGNIDVVRDLLKHGVPVDEDDDPAIANAAAVDGVDMIRLLVEHGAKINRQDELGQNAVVAAAGAGNAAVLRYLLAHGADARIAPKLGETPLTAAIDHGHLELVPLLLAHGANVTAANDDGFTPLDLVDPKWHPITYPKLMAALKKSVHPRSVWSPDPDLDIFKAAANGDLEATMTLLAHGANPSGRTDNDNTVLYYALRSRSLAVVKALLAHGASIEEREPANETPLCVAATFDELDIVHFLLDRGAKVDPGGVVYPPIDIAAYNGDTEMVRAIVDHKADVDEKDSNGETALWYAADMDDPSMAKVLLDHGAAVDVADAVSGDTPLIRAARHGRRAIVSLLLAHGASATEVNLAGQSALDVAGDGYHPGTLALLRAASQSQTATIVETVRRGRRFM